MQNSGRVPPKDSEKTDRKRQIPNRKTEWKRAEHEEKILQKREFDNRINMSGTNRQGPRQNSNDRSEYNQTRRRLRQKQTDRTIQPIASFNRYLNDPEEKNFNRRARTINFGMETTRTSLLCSITSVYLYIDH